MSGFAGIVYNDGRPIEQDVLKKMTNSLKHRGPDNGGMYISQNALTKDQTRAMHVGLGYRRLSIIDLSRLGRQPMPNEDKTIWLTYNGEIYNYKELKKKLKRSGHLFFSKSDTEVIIHGYERYGEKIFNKLNGMFAFALWDKHEDCIYLARDRYGQKPLYYSQIGNSLIFASELKALIKHPMVKKEIDIHSLSRYLANEYIPAPHSIFQNVYKLPPGHYLKYAKRELTVTPYWEIDFNPNGASDYKRISDIEDRLLYLLKSSIKRRLMSDVSLGVFLSGGLDSSAIVALMSELIPPNKIQTFSIGFKGESFDESNYAKEVAGIFGTNHHEQILTPAKMIDAIPEVCSFMDEPFADPSIIPTYLLSKFTRRHIKVALGGDGGDVLFAGYDPFLGHRMAGYYNRIFPGYIHKYINAPIVNRLSMSPENMDLGFRLKWFFKGMPYDPVISNQAWLGSFTPDKRINILSPDMGDTLEEFDPYSDMHNFLNNSDMMDPIEKIIFLYSRFHLGDSILTKVDRASMAASLEVRSPFLDVDFAEFVNQIPSKLKLKRLTKKYILKRALKDKLPKNILNREKRGFGIPVAQWFRQELKPMLLDIFSPERIKGEGIFNENAVQDLINGHLSGENDNRKELWTLMMFQMWKERFLKR